MSGHLDGRAVRGALAARLRAAAAAALDDLPAPIDDAARDAGRLLNALAEEAELTDDPALAWLILVATTGRYPRTEAVHELHRRLRADSRAATLGRVLATALDPVSSNDPLTVLEVLVDAVVVDVDYTGRHDLNTGIQRVVRNAVPTWAAEHEVMLAAWSGTDALRRLDPIEEDRVLRWSGPRHQPPRRTRSRRVLVPWRSRVVLPEVPAPWLCPTLAALAEVSGNAVSLVGYDAIPVVSADTMPPEEPERFVHYLTLVKHAASIAAISHSAGEEFSGFVDMLGAQGLRGPGVRVCALPSDVPDDAPLADGHADRAPSVLVVGSHEPRKNHLAVLHAAELLWREGLHFSLRFVGGSSSASGPFDDRVRALHHAGRAVTVSRGVGDKELWSAFRNARFTVFPSLHEGYGLPVAESLAVGTPVITSNFGSLLDLADGGGAMLVDPRDDAALTAAMRRLLTDDALRDALAAEALARPKRSWTDYARDAWDALVADVTVAAR